MTLMSLRRVSVSRGGRRVLDGIGLNVTAGAMLGVIGPNGAGKSTLLQAMAGLLPADAGEILLDGRPVGAWPRRARARRIAYLPQDPECHWPVTVARLAGLGRLPHLGYWQQPMARDAEAVRTALALTDMDPLAARRLDSLSGGERARAHLARALAAEPALLLADEPVADLDPRHALQAMAHLRRLAGRGMAVVAVLHDLTLAARFCDRLLLLDDGRAAADGTAAAVLTPDRLAVVYGITAVQGRHRGEGYLVPWTATPEDASS